MLRSSRIPPLLSRITGDGIHTALLITSDGELLGSSSIPNSNPHTHIHTPPHPTVKQASALTPISASSSTTESTSSLSSSPTSSSKFDNESIAALIAEVTSDYHRAGQELLLMNFHPPTLNHLSSNVNVPPSQPPFHGRRPMRGGGGGGSGKSTTMTSGNGNVDSTAGSASNVGGPENPSSTSSSTPSQRDHGSILSCLLLEMEMGLIGVASAGSDCLVIAIADQNNSSSIKVEHGLMKARLTAVAGYIQDTFSQLNAAPL